MLTHVVPFMNNLTSQAEHFSYGATVGGAFNSEIILSETAYNLCIMS